LVPIFKLGSICGEKSKHHQLKERSISLRRETMNLSHPKTFLLVLGDTKETQERDKSTSVSAENQASRALY